RAIVSNPEPRQADGSALEDESKLRLLLGHLCLAAFALGDVELQRHEAGDFSGVVLERLDVDLDPSRLLVLRVIEHLTAKRLAATRNGIELGHRLLIRAGTMKELAGAAALDFREPEAEETFETFVDPLDAPVRVGQHNDARGATRDQREPARLRLRAPEIGRQ